MEVRGEGGLPPTAPSPSMRNRQVWLCLQAPTHARTTMHILRRGSSGPCIFPGVLFTGRLVQDSELCLGYLWASNSLSRPTACWYAASVRGELGTDSRPPERVSAPRTVGSGGTGRGIGRSRRRYASGCRSSRDSKSHLDERSMIADAPIFHTASGS